MDLVAALDSRPIIEKITLAVFASNTRARARLGSEKATGRNGDERTATSSQRPTKNR